MPNARLHVILCSDDVERDAGREPRDGSFRPVVIDGGTQTESVPTTDNAWIDLLDLFDLGVVICQASYLALLGAGLAALQPQLDVSDTGPQAALDC